MYQGSTPHAVFISVSVFDGSGAVDGNDAVSTLRQLSGQGISVWCFDASPVASRRAVAGRLRAAGLDDFAPERIITPARSAAWMLSRSGCRTALVVGDRPLRDELEESGVDARAEEGTHADAVVVGAGAPGSGLDALRLAADRVLAGARFVALDHSPRVGTGAQWDFGPGALTAMLRYVTDVTPTVIGCPSPTLFEGGLAQLAPGSHAAVVVAGPSPACAEGAHRAGLPVIAIGQLHQASGQPPDARRADSRLHSLSQLPALLQGGLPTFDTPLPRPVEVAPCVGAVIVDESSRVLWIRRRDSGLWALPTGHLEPGERWVQAVLREVHEETGLVLTQPRLIGIYSNPRTQVIAYPDGRLGHYATAVFTLRTHVTRSDALHLARSEVIAAEFRPPDSPPSPRVSGHDRWVTRALSGRRTPEVD